MAEYKYEKKDEDAITDSIINAVAKKMARKAMITILMSTLDTSDLTEKEINVMVDMLDDVVRQCERLDIPLEVGLEFAVGLLKNLAKLADHD